MKAFKLYHFASALLLGLFSSFYGQAQSDCRGTWDFITIGSHMPFVKATIGSTEGYFLIDYATDTTVVDVNGMKNGVPAVSPNNANSFDIRFQGYTYTPKYVYQQNLSYINAGGLREGGIIGTDILSQRIYTLDFLNSHIYVVNNRSLFCTDDDLYSKGFKASSTKGYFCEDRKKNTDTLENIPTVPVKINGVDAVAQLDPGLDDGTEYQVNINRAYFDKLRQNGVDIQIVPRSEIIYSTCVTGVNDTTMRCRIGGNQTFSITGTRNEAVLTQANVVILLKPTIPAAKKCGGIGTFSEPSAQIGLSLLTKAEQIIFDPFSARIWFKMPAP